MSSLYCSALALILALILIIKVTKYSLNAFTDLFNLFSLFFIGYCLLPAVYWYNYDEWLIRFTHNVESTVDYTAYIGFLLLF